MVKQSIFILILFLTTGLSACAQQSQDSCNKYSEPSLSVSFCAPPKWTIVKKPNEPYQKVVGEEKDGLIPNIGITSGDYNGSITEFAIKGLDYLVKNYKEKGYTSVTVESQSEFGTKTTRGYRVVYNSEIQGRKLRLIQYIFAGKGNNKLVVTAYSLPSDKDVMDKVFDDAMQTFEVSQ